MASQTDMTSQLASRIDTILRSVAGRRILVIGDTMLDKYVWGDASRLSPEAPVPVVRVSRETAVAGGAANVAFNLAALGCEVSLFGRIGTDPDGARLCELLAGGGVALAPGSVSKAVSTIVKTRVLCSRQQVCRLDREGSAASYAVSPGDFGRFVAPLASAADAILVSDYAKGLVCNATLKALSTLPSRPDVLSLDPKPRPGIDYSGVFLMTPNRAEALRLAGLEETPGEFPAEAVCEAIHAKFAPRFLVVTLGAGGMLLSEGGRPVETIPTFAREVFDVSGAGDTVIAAMTAALAAGIGLGDAARFANTAAGIVVGKLGTAVATASEIRAAAGSAVA